MERRRVEGKSIFLVNRWQDNQGSLEWKRFFDLDQEKHRYVSTKLNTFGLSGRYYYEFSTPDQEILTIECFKLEKFKNAIPFLQDKSKKEEIPSLKELCGRYIASHNTPNHTYIDNLPLELRKYLSFFKKRNNIIMRQVSESEELSSMHKNDDMDIEINELNPFEETLLEDLHISEESFNLHREEIMNVIFQNIEGVEKNSSLLFDRKKIISIVTTKNKSNKGTCKVKVVFPGEPVITLSSTSRTYLMLPWKISIATKKDVNKQPPEIELKNYITFSPEIPKMLVKLIGNALDPYTREMMNLQWWKHKMWENYL